MVSHLLYSEISLRKRLVGRVQLCFPKQANRLLSRSRSQAIGLETHSREVKRFTWEIARRVSKEVKLSAWQIAREVISVPGRSAGFLAVLAVRFTKVSGQMRVARLSLLHAPWCLEIIAIAGLPAWQGIVKSCRWISKFIRGCQRKEKYGQC